MQHCLFGRSRAVVRAVLALMFAHALYGQGGEDAALVQAFQSVVPKIANGGAEEARAAIAELRDLSVRAQRLGNPSITGGIEYGYGRAYRTVGDNGEAVRHYRTALDEFLKLPASVGTATSIGMVATELYDLHQTGPAVEAYTALLRMQKASGDRKGQQATYARLIDLEAQAGRRGAAIHYAGEAEPLFDCADCARNRSSLLDRLGELLYEEGRLPESRSALERALALRRELKDARLQAETLGTLARTCLAERDAAAARKSIDEAVRLLEEGKHADELVALLNEASSRFFQAGEAEAAKAMAEKSARLASALPGQAGYAEALLNVAIMRNYARDSEQAATDYAKARDAARQSNEPWVVARALEGMSSIAVHMGDFVRAEALLDEAAAAAARAGPEDRLRALNARGVYYFRLGLRQKALLAFDEGLRASRAAAITRYQGMALHNLASVYSELGEPATATRFLEEALAIRRKLPDRFALADTLNNLAARHLEQGDATAAGAEFQEARGVYLAVGDRQRAAGALSNYGAALLRLRRTDEALAAYREALKVEEEVKDLQGVHSTLNNIALIYVEKGKSAEAEQYLRQALHAARQSRDDALAVQTQANLAMLLRDTGRLEDSRALLASVIDETDRFRGELASGELRASWFATTQDYYGAYIDVLMRLHAKTPARRLDITALEISERARARSLLENVGAQEETDKPGAEFLRRERELRSQLSSASAELFRTSSGDASGRKRLNESIDNLSHGLQTLEAERRSTAAANGNVFAARTLGWNEMRAQLDAGTALVEFSVSGEQAYLWVATMQEVRAFALGDSLELRRNAEAFIRAASTMAQAGAQALNTAGRELSEVLLRPVEREVAAGRLLIVADGVLQRVPFSALPLPGSPERPLIAKYEIVHAPSVSVLAGLRRRPLNTAARQTAAIFADPVFSATDPRVTRGPGEPEAQAPRSWPAERILRTVDVGGNEPARLAFTGEEARRIATLIPPGQRLVSTDFDASRDRVLRTDFSGYRYLHFAAHGYLDNEHPEISAIVLSLVDREGKQVDGLLRVADIARLRAPAELVVLSACESGLGKEVSGEGMTGMLQAFFQAGARRVAATLWRVNDEATAALAASLYEGMLRRGMTPAAALRAAQLELWGKAKKPEWRNPFYWAAFHIFGDWK